MDNIVARTLMPMTGLTDPPTIAGRTQDIETAAQGFEAIFASLVIKQLRETLQPDSLFGQDRGDVFGGLFDHYMGQHLAQSGALGIGALVRQQLTRTRANHADPAGPTQQPGAAMPGTDRARNGVSHRA
jgi:Rod binding domain-containing protein